MLLLAYPSGIRSKLIKSSMVVFVIVLLALAQTRAAYAAIFLFVLFAIFRLPRSTALRAFLYALATLVPVVIMTGWTSTLFAYLVREQRSVSTMSDRVPLWEYTISAVMDKSPLTGLGFYANRTITTAYNPALGTSHSAYLEIFSGGGILASLVFSVLLIVELFLALRLLLLYGKNPTVFATVGLLFGTLIIGVTSEEMVISSPTSFTFWILLSLIPALTHTTHNQSQRGEIGTGQDGSSSPRVLPATRR
jgi:O-antigen ligase